MELAQRRGEIISVSSFPPAFIACRHKGCEEFVENNLYKHPSYEISLSWRLLDISQPDTWCENTTNDISGGNCLLLKLMDHQMNDFNKISNHWVNNYSSCSSSPERAHSTPQSNTLTEQYQQMIEFKQNTQTPQWLLFWRDREPWHVKTKTMSYFPQDVD